MITLPHWARPPIPDLPVCLPPWPQDQYITVPWSREGAEGGKGKREWQVRRLLGPTLHQETAVLFRRAPTGGALGSFCWRLGRDGLVLIWRAAGVVFWPSWEQVGVVW